MSVRAADSAAPASLIPNGGFEADKNSVGWPDGWVRAKGGVTWLAENGNHFLHLAAGRPGEVVMLYPEKIIVGLNGGAGSASEGL